MGKHHRRTRALVTFFIFVFCFFFYCGNMDLAILLGLLGLSSVLVTAHSKTLGGPIMIQADEAAAEPKKADEAIVQAADETKVEAEAEMADEADEEDEVESDKVDNAKINQAAGRQAANSLRRKICCRKGKACCNPKHPSHGKN